MIKFTSLTIKNFLSYGATPTVVSLDRGGTTLILGEDLDTTGPGVGANGVGKTVIINALAYGVYDKPVSNITKDNLVNNINKKHMEVVVEFEKLDKKYKIQRVRKEKAGAAGNYVHLFEDGQDITPDSVVNTNKLIEQIVGLPYEIFVRVVVFSATHTPFLDLPVRSMSGPNQTAIIEELFGLTVLSEKASILSDQRKEVEAELKIYKARVDLLEEEKKRHEIQLKSAKERVINWDKDNKASIKKSKAEIKKIQAKLKSIGQVDIAAIMKVRDKLTEERVSLVEITGKSISEQKTLTTDIDRLTKRKEKAEGELTHLEDEKCPYCLQSYEKGKQKIKETKSSILKDSKALTKFEKRLVIVDKLLEKQLARQKTVNQKLNELTDTKEIVTIQNKNTELERKIDELSHAANPYLEPLDELEAVELEDINYDKINDLTNKIEHMKFLYKLLTKKDSFVRKVLLNKNLPFLNHRLQHYLTNLGLSHQVEFTHEMTASITQFGRALDFGNLSNGQCARVNIALSFAFRDVLQNLHEHINICMLDEVLDVGLNGVGVSSAVHMLKRKARDENISLYIISHRDEIDSAFDHVMTIQMKNGFSQILEE